MRLKLSPGIGDAYGKVILGEMGTHPGLLDYSPGQLKKHFPHWDRKIREEIVKAQKVDLYDEVQREVELIEKNGIRLLSFTDEEYPFLLKQIPDAPFLLFYKGRADLNADRSISMVGTRKSSEWSRAFTEHIISRLAPYRPHIISGLALGIDSSVHMSALAHDLPTIAVMANGILNIYPAQNRKLATEILERNGGLLSEHLPGVFADKKNFPLRNRIVAGLSPLTVVVESPLKGGSMITGKLAASYNREVGAVPGRPHDDRSSGCHYLIRSNIAHLITSAEDIADIMGWGERDNKNNSVQLKIYSGLSEEEMEVVQLMKNDEAEFWHIDELMLRLRTDNTRLSSLLLSLELQGYIQALSGKRYRLV